MALLVSTLGLVSCSALVDPDTRKLGAQPIACQPGEVATCPCDDGHWSNQRCNAGGGFDPCVCGVASTSTANSNSGHGKSNSAGQAGTPAR
jgi:hypothetical protein